MASPDLRLIAGTLLILASPSVASSRPPLPSGDLVASSVATPETRVVEKIPIPETSPAVEVRLQIDNPEQLDLDLFIYDSEPADSRRPPLCVGDSILRDEVCAVRRPEGGVLWAVIAAVAGSGKSGFTLTRSLVDSSRADLVLAEPISANGIANPVGSGKMSFQFGLESGEVATVVLDGEDRDMSVEDEEGHVFRARRTGIGRQQAAVGERFQKQDGEKTQQVDWLLRGIKNAKRYLVKLGPSGNPYGQANTILTVIRPLRNVDYLIDFSVEDLDNEPNTIEGPGRKLSRAGTRRPLLFKFLPERSPLMTAEVLPGEIYDIAICDEFGFVLSIAPDRVLWNPKGESAYKARRSSENLYFAVFPSPFAGSTPPKPPELTLLIKPPDVK